MSEEQQNNLRTVPQSSIDLNFMLTDSVWGRNEVPQGLKDKLNKTTLQRDDKGDIIFIKDKDGNFIPVGTTASLWENLSIFTRDMRLGNLSEWDNELLTVRYMINLASDLLAVNMIEPFTVAISQSATILETSQSKKGFLRRGMNTLRQEHIQQNLDPPKKSLFGGAKQDKGGL